MIKLNLNPEPRVLRQFAWLAPIGLPLLTAVVLRLFGVFAWSHPALWIAAAVGALALTLLLLGIEAPARAVFCVVTLIAMPIGFVISHVLIAVVYYLVLTPIGLVFRLMGRDVIGKRLDPARQSYWHERRATRPASSYFKLY